MNALVRESLAVSIKNAIGLGVLSALLATSAHAEFDDGPAAESVPQVETKVKKLRERVRRLESEVAALQSRHLPVEAAVDCGTGGSINETLAAHAEGEGLLTITVSGACTEAVRISRNNVVVQGGAGAAIQAPAGVVFIVSVDNNASNVTLRNLTVAGSSTGAILAHKGAHVSVHNVIAQQSGSGVIALDNGVIDVTGSTLRTNNNGAYAARGGVVSISNSTLQGNSVGVLAWKAGTVVLTSSMPDYSPGVAGPTVQGNTTGVLVRSGGFLELADATIQGNANGIVVDSGGAAHFFSRLIGNGNRVSGNGNAGVLAFRNSSLVFSDNTNTITGNVRGIVCTGNPSYIVPPGFTVTGNPGGDILGCLP